MVVRRPLLKLLKNVSILSGIVILAGCSMNQVGLGAKVDITPPKLAITSPTADGLYVKGTVHLAGTVNDDLSLKSVVVTYPTAAGDVSKTAPVTGTTWSLDLTSGPGGVLKEGAADISVTATDNSGKLVTQTRLAYVDNQRPTVLLQSPSAWDPVANKAPIYTDYIDIKGEVYDASPLTSVKVMLYGPGNTLLATHTADGTNTFSTRFYLKASNGPVAALLGLADDGNLYKYTVQATDKAGNTNTWTFHRQDIYAAMTASAVAAGTVFPTVNEVGDLDDAGAGTSPGGITYASLFNVRQNLAPAAYDFAFQYTSSPNIQFVNVDPTSPTNTLGVNAILTATIQPPATAGSAIDPSSVVTKVYALPDTTTPLISITGSGTNLDLRSVGDSYSYSLTLKNGGSPLAPGPYRLVLAAQATGSSVATKSVDFFIDSGAPYLDKGATTNTAGYLSAHTTLGGAAASPTGLAKIDIYQSLNGSPYPDANPIQTIALSGTNATWATSTLPPPGAPDGSYDYTVTLTTTSGKTTNVFHSFTYDTTLPTVSVNGFSPLVGSGAIAGTANAFAFGASDTNGITEVRWWLLPAASAAPTWSTAGSGSFTKPPYTATNYDSTSVAEGAKKLWVMARDKAGNEDTASADLQVDQTPPNLSVAATAATVNTASAGAFTGFTGTASDTNALASLSVSVDGAASQAITVTAGAWSFPWTINASTHAQDGAHSFTFTAVDAAGRSSSVVRTLTVDTKPPTTTVTSPAASGWATSASLSALGSATDGTSGTGTSAVYVKVDALYVAAGATDHSTEDPTVGGNGWTLATSTSSWTASLSLTGEGRKTLWIKALDAAGNLTDAAAAVTNRVDFGLDLLPPNLGSSDGIGTLVNAGFTLTGTTSDTNPAAAPTVSVSIDAGAGQALTVTAGAWSLPFAVNAVTHAQDGTHTFVFTATDVAGKTATLTRTITVDTTSPTMAISQPSNFVSTNPAYWLSGATATFGGSSSDSGAGTSGVASVYFKVDTKGTSHASDTPNASWTLAAGTTTWSTTVNLTGLGEGEFTLWTAVYDNVGNISSFSQRDFGIDQSSPTLTETSRAASSASKVAFTLTGTAADSNALATLTITESKDGGTANSVTFTPTPAIAGSSSSSYTTQSLPRAGVADGSYAYVLKATDAAGKTVTVNRTVVIDTTAPIVALTAIPAWITSAAYTISGTASDPGAGATGIKEIDYSLDGGAWIQASGSSTWSAILTGLAEGAHTLTVRAIDQAANTTTLSTANFGVDLASPTVTETSIPSPTQVYRTGAFTLTGAVGDSNPSSVAGTTLTVTVSVNGGAPTSASLAGSTWSYNQVLADGTYSYVVTATDVAGRTATVNRLVLLDSTAPSLTVTTPTPGTWKSTTSLSLSGTGQDGAGSGILKSYFLVDGAANDHSGDIATWNGTSGASAPVSGTSATWAATSGLPTSWTGSATLSGEGQKTLWVVAVDKAGNSSTLTGVAATALVNGTTYTIATVGTTDFTLVGAASNTVGLSFVATGPGTNTGTAWTGTAVLVPLGLDLAAPTLSESTIGTASTVVRSATVAFGGNAADSNALATAHNLTLAVDGGAASDLSFTVAPAWTASYPVNTVTHAQDGTHSFLFTATDVAGKTTTLTRSVLVDTTAASLTVSSPAAGLNTNATSLSLAGSSNDGTGSGVAEVWYRIDASANDHSADAYNAAGWTKATGTTSWSATATGLTEGTKKLWVKTLDNAGNSTATATGIGFTVDLTAPVMNESNIGAATVNKNVAFTFGGAGALSSVSDALSGVGTLKVTDNGGSVSTITPSGSNWSYAVSSLPADGTHTYLFTLTDLAGNQTTMTRTVVVDTTAAAFTVSSPTAALNTNNTVLSVAGSANDGAGSGVAEVWYRIDTSTNDHSADVYNSAGWTKATGTTSWSASVTGLTEGAKKLWVKTLDNAGNVTTAAGATAGAVAFTVDLTAPVLAETNIGAATVNKSVTFTFGGAGALSTATDALSGVGTLSVTDNGGSSTAITITAGKWNHAVSSLPADGTHTYLFTLTDLAGNQATMTRTVVVDTTPAAFTVNSPSSGLITNNTALSLAGSANDGSGSGVSQVWYRLDAAANDHSADVYNSAGWTQATGTTTWSASVTGLTEGAKKLWVKTLDNAGNVTTAAGATAGAVAFTVDLTAPVLAETNIGAATVNKSVSFTFGGAGALSTATDALSGVGTLTVTDNGSGSTGITITAGKWSYAVSSLPADGTHTYLFTLTDLAGNQATMTRTVVVDTAPATASVTTPSAGLNTSNTSLALAGSANDGSGSGVSQVWYRIDASANDHSADVYNSAGWTMATGTTTWSATATGLTEGTKKLWIKTLDNAGNVTTAAQALASAVSFTVDLTAPVLAETNIGAAAVNKNVAYTFGGAGALSTATDALSGVGTLTVTDNGSGSTGITITAGKWSYAVSSLPADGTHTYLFTLTDLAGNQTTMTRTVVVDTASATFTVSTPVASLNTNSTTLALAGSANDGAGSGVKEVWYRVDASANDHSADVYNSAGWTKATGTTSWSASVTGLTEGTKKLWIKTLDNAGNVTTAAQATAGVVAFTVDLTAPVLSETNIGAATVNKNVAFTFGGAGALSSATDALSGVGTLSVTDNGGSSTAITITAGKWSYAVSSLPADGTHTYVFTLTDLAGNQTTMTRTVVVDATPAAFTVSTPVASSNTSNTTVALSGSANDGAGSGVSQVWYRVDASGVDHSTDAYNAAGWTQATGTTTWTGSVTGLTEGTKKLWVKTLDNAGNATSAAVALAFAVPFTVDLTPPVVSESNIGAATVNKNGAFTFGGAGALSTATDALSGVGTLTVTDNGSGSTPITITAGKWSYAVSSLPADGTHTYLFTLTDLAGNFGLMTRTVVVDTTAATATVNTPAAGLNTNSTSLTLAGSTNDGSGSGVAEVWYRIDASANDHSADVYNSAGWTKTTGTTTWSATATGLTEGTKKLWVKTLDNAGNVTAAASALASAVSFTVDLTAPLVSESNIGAATVNKNVAFTFGGAGALSSATDALSGIGTLSVTDNGGSSTAITITAGKWSYAVSSLPADGTHSYAFTLTDLAGNQTTMTRTVVVDTTAATATVSTPTAAQNTNGTNLALAGSANDGSGSGVAEVWYRIDASANDHSADVYNSAGWTKATGTTTWSATATGLTEGTKKLWVKTLDNAGNVTTAAGATAGAVSFTVDLTAPVLAETTIGAATVSKNVGFTFGGAGALSTATDALSGVGTLSVTDNGGSSTAITITAGKWNYIVSSLPADGTHTYLFTLTDLAGNQTTMTRTVIVDTTAATASVTTPAAALFTNSTALTLAGSANDGSGSGVSQVWYRIDASANDHSADVYNSAGWTMATGTTTWTASVTGLTEGAKKLWVKTLDGAGNVTTAATALASAVSFTVDLTVPVLAETTIGAATVNKNVAYTFGGAGALSTATDALSGVGTLSVTDNGGSSTAITITAGKWSYAVSSLPADGTHTYVFTLTDLAGNQTTMTRTVVVDTTPATATVVAPAASSYSAATVTLTGSANDGSGSGVSQVWYRIDASANDHSADVYNSAGWTMATGTTTWSATATGLTEGTKKLWIKTLDVAGNVTSAATALASAVSFTVDLTPPTLGETGVGASTSRATGFSFTGTASDPNGLAASHSVQVAVDGAAAIDVTGTTSWTYAVSVNAATHADDGTHTYTFTATDAAGKTTTLTRTILVDTSAPAVTFNNISGAGGTVFQDTTGKVTGTLTSASGLGSAATVLLEQYTVATATWSTVSGFNNLSLGITGSPKTFSWTVDLGTAGLPDGRYRLSFVVPNATTPTLTLDTTATPVTFLWSRANPTLAIVTPTMGTYQNGVQNGTNTGTFTLYGTSADLNSVTAVVAKLGTGGSIDLSSGTTTALPAIAVSSLTNAGLFQVASATGLANNSVIYVGNTGAGAQPVATGSSYPVSPGTAYYVKNLSGNTFNLTTTSGGSTVITFTNVGSSLVVASPALPFGGTSVSWMVPTMDLSTSAEGPVTAYVQVTAGSTKTSVASRDFTKDTTQPTITVSSPPANNRVVGDLSLVGISSDSGTNPSGVASVVQYALGKSQNPGTNPSPSWTNASGGAYSWTINLSAATLGLYSRNTTETTEVNSLGNVATGTDLWLIPIYLRTVDNAGNVKIKTDYTLILDPNGNTPVVTLTQPLTSGASYGGQVRISGTATQPIWIHDVELAVDPTGGSNFPATPTTVTSISGSTINAPAQPFVVGQSVYFTGTVAPQVGGSAVSATTPYYVLTSSTNSFTVTATSGGVTPVTFSSGGTAVTASVWAPATLVNVGNTVNWYYDINTLNQYPQGGTSQNVSVQVRAWNSATVGGVRGSISGTLASALAMNFNATFPKFTGLQAGITATQAQATTYYSSMTTSGTTYFWGTISTSKGLAKIERLENTLSNLVTQIYPDPNTSDLTVAYVKDQTGSSPWAKTTVTPPTTYAAGSFPTTVNVMVTAVGASTNWSAIGGPNPAAVGSVFKPTGNGAALTGATVIAADLSGNFNYAVTLQVDTTKFFSGSAGVYSFDLRATDETAGSPQVASTTLNLNVDNYSPTSNGTTGTTNLAVTLDATTDTFTAAGHKLSNGNIVFLNGTNIPTVATGYADISEPYFVVAAATNTFQLSSTYPAVTLVDFTSSVASNLSVTRSSVAQTLTGSVNLQGSAQDVSPTVTIGGLKRVVAYLEKSGQIVDMTQKGTYVAGTTLTAKDMTNAVPANAGTLQSVLFPSVITNAGSFVSGHVYKILTPGNTTFTSIGSTDNNSGTKFTASGVGSGGGTALDYTLAAKYAASMDDLTESGFSDVNGDGWVETFTSSGNSTNWSFTLDSTKLADGGYTLHYVVFDNAGNATHYTQAVYVSNYGPQITGVQLGTDVNADATIAAGEVSSTIAVQNTSFTVRNKLLSVKPVAVYNGANNGALAYTLDYYNGSAWVNYPIPAFGAGAVNGVSISNVDATYHVGETVTLNWNTLAPAIADVAANGAPMRITLTDSTPGGGQAVQYLFNIGIQNTDTTAPTVDLSPFGLRWSAPLDAANGSVNTDTGKTLGTVTAYTDNVGGTLGALTGHVEYATDSRYNPLAVTLATPGTGSFTNTGTNNLVANSVVYFAWTTPPSTAPNGTGPYYVIGTPTATAFQVSATKGGSAAAFGTGSAGITLSSSDVSGRVIFRGKYWDNQRIASLTVKLAGYNSGTAVQIAVWSASANSGQGGLVQGSGTGAGTDWTFSTDSGAESVSQADGQAANWSWSFDTSKITTVAAANVAVTFTATDAAGLTGTTSANVDIVPYITALTNTAGQGLSSDVLRSSTGKYSMDTNASTKFNVAGFNLGAAATYTPTTYISAAPITAASGQNPATTFVSSSSLQVAKTMTAVRSGYLTVFVNAVPSTNNLNLNTALSGTTTYNKEVDATKPYSSQWNDDRYLWFWTPTRLNAAAFNNQTYNYPDMVMSGTQPIFTYDNDNNGFNYRTTSDTATAQKVGLFYQRLGALAVNQDPTTPTWYIMSTEDAFGGSGIGNLTINRDINFSSQGVNATTYTNNNNVYEIINEDNGARSLNRFKYPKLMAEGTNTGTQLYSTVYDNYSKQIYFISFQNTGSAADNMTEVAANGGIASNGIVALAGTTNASSQYFAMTKVGAGTTAPVAIAYFDPSTSTLKLTYSSNHTTTNLANTGATWTTITVDSTLYNGSDVSMVNDGTYLYLAYYDSANGDLRFAQITWSTKAVTTYTVDSYLSVGTWTNISLMNGVPYIAYYTASFNGTIKPVKLAFPTDGLGGVNVANTTTDGANAADDTFTGTWEAMTIPTVTSPQGGQEQFNHVQLGAYLNNTQTQPVVGWLGTTLEYAKLQPNN